MTEGRPTRGPALDSLGDWARTHTCGELEPSHVDQHVLLMGWVIP